MRALVLVLNIIGTYNAPLIFSRTLPSASYDVHAKYVHNTRLCSLYIYSTCVERSERARDYAF